MTALAGLPENVLELMRSGSIANYTTVSAAGMPIDTPVLYFPEDDLSSFNLTTGLSYPAKAERARRNPKVGLLLMGRSDEPVISIAGVAAVRDADLQANVIRYVAEACYTLPHDPDWALARQAVWYWTRMLVTIAPARIDWWDNAASMDRIPHRWDASEGTVFPGSDPAPPGKTSRPPKWLEKDWRELADQALERGAPGHLSVIDEGGFPRPICLNSIELSETGFALSLPRGLPWPITRSACLTFGGIETFLGEVSGESGSATMIVERSLPIFPMTRDMTQLWEPTPETRSQLMRRLEEELQRRSQPLPSIPIDRPQPTEGYRRRMERMKAAGAAG
ncbi:MAG: pyridoxamine 5'-phosphate oxidase family protein [Novosphingobium sp.]|nr:pyridoxamine 5'-phosphate oxidase family protein [Novosphingobium sp.]